MLRIYDPEASLEQSLGDEIPATRTTSNSRIWHKRRSMDSIGLDFDGLRGQVDAEMSLALTVGTPLALGGASLLAHGLTVPNRTCLVLGAIAVVGVGLLLGRTRHRVRRAIVRDAELRGMSSAEGKRLAKEYLSTWSR